MSGGWRTILAASVGLLMALAGCRGAHSGGAVRSASPDNLTIDTFSYSYSPIALEAPDTTLPIFAPSATLSITRAGNVHYTYSSQPQTNSGGRAIVKDWQISSQEARSVLDGLVADGLLELPTGLTGRGHGITVTHGRWQLTLMPASMPERIIARLRPYIEKGQADLQKAP